MRTQSQIAVSVIFTLVCALSARAQAAELAAEPLNTGASASTTAKPAQESTKDATTSTAQPEARDEKSRDYSLYRHNSLMGGTGLLHTVSADSGAPGTFRISFLSSYYSGKGFLCPSVASCGLRPAGVTATEDSASRIGADWAASATLLPFLEANLGIHYHSVSDNFGTPKVIQVLGDTALGLKGFTPRQPDRIFSVGGMGQLRLLNSSGGIGIHAANFTLGALGTLDLTNRQNPALRIPVRFHSNLGYRFDNSSSLMTEKERTSQRPISRIERFSYGINRVDSLLFGLGGEFMHPLFQPFAEWTVDIASNRQDFQCHLASVSAGDICLSRADKLQATPSRLTFGTRVTPPLRGLSAVLAFDIGTSKGFVEERAPEIPWNLYLGVAYAVDTVTQVVQTAPPPPKVIPIALPPERHIVGKVFEEGTSKSIARAMIQYEGPDQTGMVTRADGSFESGDIKPGEYMLLVSADGYRDGTCAVTIEAELRADKAPGEAPTTENTEVKCFLKPAPLLGAIHGTLLDAETNAPIVQARITIHDNKDRALDLQSDATGTFHIDNIPTGHAQLTIVAEGYLPNVAELEVKHKVEEHAGLLMHKIPKKANVTVAAKEVKLNNQVHFATDSANIAPDSQSLIQEIAAVLQQHPELKSVEIQGYMDDAGTPAFSQHLSEERAQAVRTQLINLGVDANRLKATGFGSDKPPAPNNSEANRVKNRRVQLVIKQHE